MCVRGMSFTKFNITIMKKTTIDFTLFIFCIIGFVFTGFYGLAFIGGIFLGDYLIVKYNWFPEEEDTDEEQTWASQFQINSEQDQNQIEE